MIGLLLALYPSRWRARYGEEFRAVLESRPLGPFDVADVLLGALDARLTPFRLPGTSQGGHVMLLRIGGFGAVFGAAAWFVGLAASSGIGTGEESRAWLGVMVIGTIGLLFALVGLSAFQGQRRAVLTWVAFVIPALGTIVSAGGAAAMWLLPENGLLFGSWSPWGVWILGLMATLFGSMLFALATYQANVFSRRAALALGGASALILALVPLSSGGEGAGTSGQVVMVVAILSFAVSWMWLGISALRRGPIREITPA